MNQIPGKVLIAAITAAALACVLATGCSKDNAGLVTAPSGGPDYTRPLPPGASALRLVTDPSRMPDIGAAYRDRDAYLNESIDFSKVWFEAPSSQTYFPFESITHQQAKASLYAMSDLLQTASSESAFVADMQRIFDVYESVGYNGQGVVLFTGYYSPVFDASRYPSSEFTHPLYTRPADLATDPQTGAPLGRRNPDGTLSPYPTRREIEQSNMFAGNELVWMRNALDAYIVHVNGSAKLRMTDGTELFVGYAGKTDREYSGLGQKMLDAGLVTPDKLSLSEIKRAFKRDPRTVTNLMMENDSYVFFQEYPGGNWPAGSLGVRVTTEASLATDKSIYPRGGLVLVDTDAVTFSNGKRTFNRFLLDQDTGGAIKAPGRADIFMGIGPGAEILAGGQYAEGRLYYFFLKPQYIAQYSPDSPAPLASR